MNQLVRISLYDPGRKGSNLLIAPSFYFFYFIFFYSGTQEPISFLFLLFTTSHPFHFSHYFYIIWYNKIVLIYIYITPIKKNYGSTTVLHPNNSFSSLPFFSRIAHKQHIESWITILVLSFYHYLFL